MGSEIFSGDELQAASAAQTALGTAEGCLCRSWQGTAPSGTFGETNERMAWERGTHATRRVLLTHIFREEDDEERSDQVIDPLDIPTGGVSDGPDKENSLKDLGDEKERGGVNLWTPLFLHLPSHHLSGD